MRGDRGAVVLIQGEAGSGKSALLGYRAEHAQGCPCCARAMWSL
jgi:ABC-type lipoprotein export system ATPase subunit